MISIVWLICCTHSLVMPVCFAIRSMASMVFALEPFSSFMILPASSSFLFISAELSVNVFNFMAIFSIWFPISITLSVACWVSSACDMAPVAISSTALVTSSVDLFVISAMDSSLWEVSFIFSKAAIILPRICFNSRFSTTAVSAMEPISVWSFKTFSFSSAVRFPLAISSR